MIFDQLNSAQFSQIIDMVYVNIPTLVTIPILESN